MSKTCYYCKKMCDGTRKHKKHIVCHYCLLKIVKPLLCDNMKVFRCVLCERGIVVEVVENKEEEKFNIVYGHDAYPLAEGRCCDKCNKARIMKE